MVTKVCTSCKQEKELDEFYAEKHGKYGRNSICKVCKNVSNKIYQYEHGLHSPMNKNKNSPMYLGCHITEKLLSNVFENVVRMPVNNKGFDFTCSRNYKIDSKASIIGKCGKYDRWLFHIRENKIADYFYLIAFDNRNDLNVLHSWLVPGYELNHIKHLSIYNLPNSIDTWNKYEKNFDKISAYCNVVKKCNL